MESVNMEEWLCITDFSKFRVIEMVNGCEEHGKENIEVRRHQENNEEYYDIECTICGQTTKYYFDLDEAIEAWNEDNKQGKALEEE